MALQSSSLARIDSDEEKDRCLAKPFRTDTRDLSFKKFHEASHPF
jgi:hypothetical protein